MLSTILLARAFETSAFAAFSLFQLTISTLAAYAAMGLGVTASRFFAEAGNVTVGQTDPPLGALWLLSSVAALVVAIAILAVPEAWLNGGLEIPRWLTAVGVLVVAIRVVPAGAVLGLERFRAATAISALSGGLMVAGAFVAAVADSAVVAMSSVVVASLVQGMGESVVVIRSIGWRRIAGTLVLNASRLATVVNMAGPMFLVSLMSASGTWVVGRVILDGSGGQHAFAIYSIGLQWFSLALLLPSMLTRAVLPQLVRVRRVDDGGRAFRTLVRRGAMLAAAAALLISLLGLLFGSWLITWYGEEYELGRWFLAAFMGVAIISAPTAMIGNALVTRDGQATWLLMTGIWFVILFATVMAVSDLAVWAGVISQGVAAAALAGLAIVVARKRRLI